jgi:hypothetical protein
VLFALRRKWVGTTNYRAPGTFFSQNWSESTLENFNLPLSFLFLQHSSLVRNAISKPAFSHVLETSRAFLAKENFS